jgi:hypothetical protein
MSHNWIAAGGRRLAARDIDSGRDRHLGIPVLLLTLLNGWLDREERDVLRDL